MGVHPPFSLNTSFHIIINNKDRLAFFNSRNLNYLLLIVMEIIEKMKLGVLGVRTKNIYHISVTIKARELLFFLFEYISMSCNENKQISIFNIYKYSKRSFYSKMEGEGHVPAPLLPTTISSDLFYCYD